MPVAEQQMTRAQAVERVSILERENADLRERVEILEAATPRVDRDQILVTVPAVVTDRRASGYVQTRLTRLQARGLRAVFDATEGRAKVDRGRPTPGIVSTQIDALRFLLELVARSLPAIEGASGQ